MVEGFATSVVSDNAQIPLMSEHKIGKMLVASDLQKSGTYFAFGFMMGGVATPFVK